MEKKGPGIDLVEVFARPLPSLVMCELLGVPETDREELLGYGATINGHASGDRIFAAVMGLRQYVGELIVRKRAEPTDDVLGGLVGNEELSDDELFGLTFLLFVAGTET